PEEVGQRRRFSAAEDQVAARVATEVGSPTQLATAGADALGGDPIGAAVPVDVHEAAGLGGGVDVPPAPRTSWQEALSAETRRLVGRGGQRRCAAVGEAYLGKRRRYSLGRVRGLLNRCEQSLRGQEPTTHHGGSEVGEGDRSHGAEAGTRGDLGGH